ncbi:MAG: ATP-binding protein [Flavipsychrobacter sp.]
MFRKYPYRGWLLISTILWAIVVYKYYNVTRHLSHEQMAKTIEADYQEREKQFARFVNDEELVKSIFEEQEVSTNIDRLTDLPFFLYAYKNNTLTFWNNNKVLADCGLPTPSKEGTLYYNDRGVFVKKCVRPTYLEEGNQLVILYPIVTKYPFENNYLKSQFVAADYIPFSTKVISRQVDGSHVVNNLSGKPIFFINFYAKQTPAPPPSNTLSGLIIAAVLLSMLWLQLLIINLTRKHGYGVGLGLTIGIVFIVRGLNYWLGLPFNLETLPLFTPQLYASTSFLKSLGDLLLNALCLLWIVIFMVRHVPTTLLSDYFKNKWIKKLVGLFVAVCLLVYSFSFINIISTLIMDSRISFDVSHFYTISAYTIVGLFTIGIITSASILLVYFFNCQLTHLINNKWLKYLLVAALGLVFILISDKNITGQLSYILLGWLLLFIILLDVKKLTMVSDLFSPRMIFWAAFICAFCAGILQYFNYLKERDTRLRFAEEVVQQRDDVTEYTFNNIAENIQTDPILISFLKRPRSNKRWALNERFDALYLGGQLNKYNSKVLIFDTTGVALFNDDTLSYKTLNKQLVNALPTIYSSLYYKEYAQDGHYYLGRIPITIDINDSTRTKLGYVYIDLAIKESTGETIYPELLQPGTVKSDGNQKAYSYGVYINDKLITQTNDHNFPAFLRDSIATKYEYSEWSSSSELRYKADDTKTVIVIRYHRMWLESITLFSYLFGMLMIIAILMAVYKAYFIYFLGLRNRRIVNLTLRRRIHLSMLGIVFISFIIIGLTTITFFTYQYKQSNRRKQEVLLQLVERSTLQFLNSKNALDSLGAFNKAVADQDFKYFLTGLANAQNIDINLYDASGVLGVTSQSSIYDKSLFARIMHPAAYSSLHEDSRQFLVKNEEIGRLKYLSCYSPLRNENGNVLGYINAPFFSSQKELNFQISGILVALINLYAFVFLISGILTLFITRWLTRTLNVVISRFEKFSLSKNELIEWPYDDEIGLLIKEYNKMVRKVESNAKLLAQSERESAWREMAKQVAHEIKNPLTPMKLNIQYLQKALKNDYDNVNELATKVSASLIEQIDNLSYIASEFSNFAKMPQARPERLELNRLIINTIHLYDKQEATEVSFQKTDEEVYVFLDKSQLLRIFTNLLENAVQAIPENIKGVISVTVKTEEQFALVTIKDNGTGIDEEVIDKIFQPYFTTKSSGTGLGLAMTKKIIEFWGGNIWFETEKNKGTTFFIKLPIVNQ